MSDISPATIYSRLKRMLGRIKDRDPKEIRADSTLRGDLRFSSNGVRGLASHINREFEDFGVLVTPEETGNCETVKDLYDLIKEKIENAEEEN